MRKLINEVLQANLDLPKHGLVVFTWGNASGIDRKKGRIVIKPSGIPYEAMNDTHMVEVDTSGNILSRNYKPSSDTPTHLVLYNCFPDIGGIVHCHSKYATAWAQSGRELPAYGTTHADYFYGSVPCTRWLTPDEIASDYELNTGKVVAEAFERINPIDVPGVLVAGHAPFCWGATVADAVHNAVVLELCAMIATQTEMLNAKASPVSQTLLDKHYQRKHGTTAYFGQ